jgi:WD40 repeat protein
VRLLRGHRGQVLGMAFAPPQQGKELLISAAYERDEKANRFRGVIRLWDVDGQKCIASLTKGLPSHNQRLALAAWPTGKDLKQLQVAIAWGDGSLRIWDVERGDEEPQKVEVGALNNTVAFVPGSHPKVLTTAFAMRKHGVLQAWNVPEGGGEVKQGQSRFYGPTLNPQTKDYTFFKPRALTALSSRANGRLDHAAVIQETLTSKGFARGEKPQARLQLIDLTPDEDAFGKVKSDLTLWPMAASAPVVATAPKGQFLAVAGDRDHEIQVFTIADLLEKQERPQRVRPQVLRSDGVTVQVDSIITKGKALGLRLSQAGGGEKRPDLVLDFTNRNLSSDPAGWKTAAPDVSDWKVKWLDDNGKPLPEITVTRRGERVGRPIRLQPTQRLTRYALLPPRKPWNTPLLAIAYLDYDSGDSVLCLYDVTTGERVRQFAGHVDAVRSLVFSADGKLLASAAEDQTVCVWSLEEVERILGKRGQIAGLAVGEGEGGVVVKKVDKDSPAAGKLAAGDLVQDLILQGGKFQALDSPRKFYETMWQQKPGDTVRLRVKNKQPVSLKVGQGVDERNPLFSVFVTRPDQGGDQEWIGWSPAGYYDCSADGAARHLLWHYNKASVDQPTATVEAKGFREEYKCKGLLHFLAARGNLGTALEDWKREKERDNSKPVLLLSVVQAGPNQQKRDGQGRVPVQSRQITLKLKISGFPLKDEDVVLWQFGDGAWQDFTKRTGTEWSVDLAKAPWKWGTNTVRAVLRTDGIGPQRYFEELPLNYQPPPPTIVYGGALRQVVNKQEFVLKAQVKPGLADEPVQADLSHKHENKELLPTGQRAVGLDINRTVQLKPGLNLVQVSARYKKAPPEAEGGETARLAVEVIYTKKDAPPLIDLEIENSATGARKKVRPGEVVVVDVPRVRLTGEVRAEGKLTQAKWAVEGTPAKSLNGFEADRVKRLAVKEEFFLDPDLRPRTVRFTARTKTSEPAEAWVQVVYRPLLPRLELMAPEDGLELYDDKDQPAAQLEGKFTWPEDFRAFQAEILVNSRAVAARKIDRRVATLADKVRLTPGDNNIRVRLTNEWGRAAMTDPVVVRFLRRPKIQFVAAKPPVRTNKALIDLEARITSPVPLKKEVRAEVNGSGGPKPVQVTLGGPKKDGSVQVWTVRLSNVSLDEGRNEVSLWASNEETSCREPARLVVIYDRPEDPPPPPEVELVEPAKDITVTRPNLTVRARIRSAKPLTRVEVICEDKELRRIPADVSRLRPNPQGFADVAVDVTLVPGKNVLRVEAANAGKAQQSRPVVVTFERQRPVRVEITHLLVKGSAVKLLPQKGSTANDLRFGQASRSRIWVVGQVTWDPEIDPLLRQDFEIDFYVNGLRQLPADLEVADGNRRVRTFRAEVSLTRERDNRIRVELPSRLKQSTDNRPVCRVDCKQPVERQRVYLLPISVGETDEKALLNRIFRALQARDVNLEQERFRTPVFYEGRLYGPLTGYVNRRQVLTQLNRIKQEMLEQKKADLRGGGDAPGDVLVLYFRGSESVAAGKYEFRTSDKQVAISRDQLLREFQEALGAQILFLDVAREAAPNQVVQQKDRQGPWPDDSPVTVLGFAWLDPAAARRNNPWLIDALADALRQGGRLGDVAAFVKAQFKKAPPMQRRGILYEHHRKDLAEDLADLLLSARGRGSSER